MLEEEFAHDWRDGTCRLWFFTNGLPGYSWYVPKAGGHLNVGIGGMAGGLHGRGEKIRSTGSAAAELASGAWCPRAPGTPGGYTYYLRGRRDLARLGNAFVAGDSAGLATRDLAEGIGPAIRSGLHAADAIAQGAAYDLRDVARYSVPGLLRETALGRAVARRGR